MMDDIINYGKSYILRHNDGTIWYFFLTENKRVAYTTREGDDWSSIRQLDSQPLKGYSVTMNKDGDVKLLAYTETRQLLYYELDQGGWKNKTIERIYSRFQDIVYYNIVATTSGTHIVYYINHSLNRSAETLVHYHISQGKWNGGRLWRFISDQFTRPMDIHENEFGNLSMIFTQKTRQRYNLYYSDYDSLSLSWVDPILIQTANDNYNYRLFNGSNGNLHIVWAHKIGEGYEVTLLSRQSSREDGAWVEALVYRGRDRILNPFLLMDEKLHCFWMEEDSIRGSFSKDSGLTWSDPQLFGPSQGNNIEITIHNLITLIDGTLSSMVFLGPKGPYNKLFGLKEYPVDWIGKITENTPSSEDPEVSILGDAQIKARDLYETQRALASIKRDNRVIRESLNNLLGEIDRMNNTIYSLQEQAGMNEQVLFNVNARIKQLDFLLNQIRSKPTRTRPYSFQSPGFQSQNTPIGNRTLPEDVEAPKADPNYTPTVNGGMQIPKGNSSVPDSKMNDNKPQEPRDKNMPTIPPRKNITIRTRPLYDYGENIPQGDSIPTSNDNESPPFKDKDKTTKNLKEMNPNGPPKKEHEDVGETGKDMEKTTNIVEQTKNKDAESKVIGEHKETKSYEGDGTKENMVEFHVIDDNENIPKEKEDIQKISLGNTTILINPDDPDDLT